MIFSTPHVPIAENVSAEMFREEIFPAARPVLMKGLVAGWPAVAQARQSAEAVAAYIAGFDIGRPVETNLGRPEIAGKFFYNERMDGFNFERRPEPLRQSLDRILQMREEENPPSIYIQSAPIADYLPAFAQENILDLPGPGVSPRIWIGNRLNVQTHFDLQENIACCVAGRRRFTLFPPEQTPNMYCGPFELTLAGPPVSMVSIDDPDFGRYPRFREALEHAVHADLEPGDALYVPYFWWHNVRAQDDFNVLVNYWWNDAPKDLGSPFDAMLHALIAIRDLPERQRKAWQTMFGHYVFGENGDPVAHLPAEARGMLGTHDRQLRQQMRMILMRSIGQQAGLKPPPRPGGKPPGQGR